MQADFLNQFAVRMNWSLLWLRAALALCLGSLAVLGFSPYDFPFLTLFALVGLWYFWSTSSSWRSGALEGLAFGLGFFGYGISWLGISLGIYGGVPLGFTWMIILLFVLMLSLFMAIVGAAAVYTRSLFPKAAWALLLLPSFWVASEWLRVVLWDGFPWLLIGYSHTDSWLAGWAPLGGTLAVSFAVALSAGLIWLFLKSNHRFIFAISFGVFWAVSGQLAEITWVQEKGQTKSIALVHGQVSEKIKWSPDALVSILRAYQQASEPFFGRVDLVVWPETAIPAFLDSVMPALEDFNLKAEQSATQVISGVALREDRIQGRRYFNSVVSLDASVRYDKKHLVPFSEYYPGFSLLSAFARLMNMPMSQFSVGDLSNIQTIANQQVGLAVCYEADFGTEMARVSANADWWLVVSDDGWFYPSAMAGQHWQMTRLRARELGREIVRVTNQGYSGVAKINGQGVIAAFPNGPLEGHEVSVQAFSGTTPYVRYHDWPLLSVILVTIALVLVRVMRARRQQ